MNFTDGFVAQPGPMTGLYGVHSRTINPMESKQAKSRLKLFGEQDIQSFHSATFCFSRGTQNISQQPTPRKCLGVHLPHLILKAAIIILQLPKYWKRC